VACTFLYADYLDLNKSWSLLQKKLMPLLLWLL